ncbi:MAG: hydantoinase/oxoprolinase family protein, partial [Candidatus Eremiobacteraeota bacterium]|nr:hydantoinase/oxoprolinase family protein [Candidatus Eremiobacteraeota bacterium]MBV9263255.1 hydantoinase/oxoprolinase family protein [Candidatus Eremiobacteraeota bacterium]
DGNVLVPLDDACVIRVCEEVRARDAPSVAICLLHSYANDVHERRLAEALAAALPQTRIAVSSHVDPQYREYERCSTTVVNAALAPIVEAYLERLIAQLCADGIEAPLYVMRSDGGMSRANHAMTRPAALLESGPASGAIASAALGARVGAQRLLSFDMGGTTAKAGTILEGIAQVAYEFEAAGAAHSGRAIKGSGYPVRFPFVDLAEVSAGGGTIAWIDDAGALRVGPQSAGADPGPACYGASERATVTDANVALGRLNETHLLGGAFRIDALRARAAILKLANALASTVEATSAGIVALIDDAMAKALRIVTIERGIDPRDFTLVAFGGGGPLHACALADALEIRRIIVPAHPGLFSAFGLLQAELCVNELRPVLATADALDMESMERDFAAGERRARAELLEQGAHAGSITFRREFDARYRGQSFELTISHDSQRERIAARFHEAHRARYGYDVGDEVVEIVNARVTASGSVTARSFVPARSAALSAESKGQGDNERKVWVDGDFTDVPVFQRDALENGVNFAGPAIVEQYDTTTYLAPDWKMTVEDDLLLLRSAER